MLTNSERPSGVEWMPVISHSFGPTRKRRSAAPGALPTRVVTEPVAAPIVGATKTEHIDKALGALDLELTAEEIASLEEPYVPHAVVGALPEPS